MVGLCGVVGERGHQIEDMIEMVARTNEEQVSSYDDGIIQIGCVNHSGYIRQQPAVSERDALVWVWGDIWGYEHSAGYQPRRTSDSETIAEFCAQWYDEDGIDFADGLNGTFVAVLYDRVDELVYLVTDRLATHPIYYAHPRSGEFVFSTQIQAFPQYTGLDIGFDVEYLCEYFALGSVGGTKTPLTGVNELPPSSVTIVDIGRGTVETERYWRPRFAPLDRPFSYFVGQFIDRFQAALADRFDPDMEYGLLLSGGSDSRTILAGAANDLNLRTYHVTGWESVETRTAKRVADVAGRECRLLARDRDSHKRMLHSVPETMNFIGRFCEAHVSEFADELRDEVDVLISGHGADTLFRDHPFPLSTLSLGSIGTVELPVAREVGSVETFISGYDRQLPEYLDTSLTLRDILERNITVGEMISHHGVDCSSVDELLFFDDCYPFSNKSDFFFHGLNEVIPHWSPFFDNRLIDLALRIPLRHRIRRNVVNAAISKLDRSLAEIPHSNKGVPLTRSFPVNFLWYYANEFKRKYLPREEPPEQHQSHGPWVDANQIIRSHTFVEDTLREKKELIESLPFLSSDGVERHYREHLNGAQNHFELYTLLSFVQMPAVEHIAAASENGVRTR